MVHVCAMCCCSQDGELESFTEARSSLSEKSLHPRRDHSYSYDTLSLLSATSESLSMNYWSPVSQPRAHFHPMLSPPAVISLAPQMPYRALEMPCSFIASPLSDTRVTTMYNLGSAERLTHKTGVAAAAVYRQRRSSLPSEFPLNLYVGTSSYLNYMPEGSLTRRTVDISSVSKLSGGVTHIAESAMNISALCEYSAGALSLTSYPPLYVPSTASSPFYSVPETDTKASVTVSAVSSAGDGMVKGLVLDRCPDIISTAASVGAVSGVCMPRISVDSAEVMVNAAVSQHRDTVVCDAEQCLSSSELFSSPADSQCFSSLDFDVTPLPTAAAATSGDDSDQMPTTAAVSTAQPNLQATVPSSSLRFVPSLQAGCVSCPEISQALVASGVHSSTADTVTQYPHLPQVINAVTQYNQQSQVRDAAEHRQRSQVSDTVADYPQQSDISEPLPSDLHPAAAAQSLPCPVSEDEVPKFSVQIRNESCDILQSQVAAADVHPIKMETDAEKDVHPSTAPVEAGNSTVEQCPRVLDSAAVESSLCGDNKPLLSSLKQETTAISDQGTDVNPALAATVPNSVLLDQTTADDAVVKPKITAASEDTGQQCDLSLLSMESEHCAGASSMEPISDSDAVQKSLGDVKPDKELVAGIKAADEEMVTGDAPVSAVSTASSRLSDDVGNESQPTSEPGSAAVVMEVSIPAASVAQQCSPPSVVIGSNADDVATSAASAETDKNERFRELMIKCTKALELCLTRFPQHYKSLYRLADVFFRCSCLKVSHLAFILCKL